MQLAIKIDVDTDRGTREGVPYLVEMLEARGCQATFLFSLGPDNTGKAIRRIFRPGFFKKVSRTNVRGMYGMRTLLNGTLLPAPHIGKRCEAIMQTVQARGFEVGIHCYDHFRWQDYLHRFNLETTRKEFGKALAEFERIFGEPAQTAGAPGWQANERSLQVYDEAGFLYGSDTRGECPFFPKVGDQVFKTLQIPTTLPTLDELLGRPEFPEDTLADYYLSLLKPNTLNVLTIHAEIEGMSKAPIFEAFLDKALSQGAECITLEEAAHTLLETPEAIPTCNMIQGEIPGRSGLLALQELSLF